MRNFMCIAVLLILCAATGLAQINGDVKGIVLDSTGSSVPNAKVTLHSLETGEARSMTADAEGRFAFNILKIGLYEVKAEAQGFRTSTTRADVRAGEIASVRFSLEVGQVTETIQVTDAVAAIDTENAQIQVSLQGETIQEIPVGRDPNKFALTAPGVTPVTSNNSFLGSGSFNTNGGRGRGNNVTVDNITSTDVSVTGTGGALGPLNFSQIKEVKVITNNFNAEYGRNSSSQLMYITKSGTNDFHGEVYDYLQNDKLNARPFFDSTGKTNIVRINQYGFAVGGPVWLPKIFNGKNKTHFFTSWEQNPKRGAGEARIAFVPTPAQLSAVTDPTSRALLQQYQLPAATTIGENNGQVQQQAATTADSTQFSVRIDHQLTGKDTLTGKYSQWTSQEGSSGLTFIGTNLSNFGATSAGTPKQANLAETHIFSPSVVNEIRFSFGRSTASFPINTTVPLGPRISFQNGQISTFGLWEGLPQGRLQNTFQTTDTLSWMKGPHNFKMGADVYRYQANSFFDALQRPVLAFPSWDDFAAGKPFSVQQRFGSSVRGNRVLNHFYFFQDDWKVSRNLTLNLGVRVEVAGGVNEVNGLISNLNLDCRDSMGRAGTGAFGCLKVGDPSFGTNTNWGPRVGFAWSPFGDQKTVIRGGYGIAYDFVFLNPITNQRFLPPFIYTGTMSGTASFTGDNSYARMVAGTSQLQSETRAQTGQISTTALNYGSVSPGIDFGLRNPQVQQFSLGVQREVLGHVAVKATYVGTKGTYLPRSRSLNLINDPRARPATSLDDETARLSDFLAVVSASTGNVSRASNRIDPRFNTIDWMESSANSIYHSLQLEADKRFSRGFLFRAAYTYGKAIDDNSDVLGVLINDDSSQQNPLDNRNNRAVSQFDLAQRFVFTHSWELPWGKGISNGFLRRVVYGWGFTGITSFRTGFPVTFTSGSRRGVSPITINGIASGAAVRPNATGPINFNPAPSGSAGTPSGLTTDPIQRISAYAASLGLSQPLIGNFGNLGRNALRLNGERNFDWAVAKKVVVREGMSFELRGEFYNTFNNTSFQDVSRNISNTSFGQYTTVAQNARTMQVAARFVF